MIKLLNIRDFAVAGINSDMQPWDLPPSNLTDIRNIRIIANQLLNYRGYALWVDLPAGAIPGYIMNVNNAQGGQWLIGCHDAVYAFNGAGVVDVSNVLGYAGLTEEITWSGCQLSDIPIINADGIYPEFWNPQSIATLMQDLPWDVNALTTWRSEQHRCRIMRSHKQYLFALDLTDNSANVPDGVRWSSPADIGNVPESWDELDVTNVAGITTLGATGGKIVDGLSLRDAFAVYRQTSISIFDYVGGPFVWQIRTQSSTFGLINQDCLVEVDGDHYFMGRDDIYINDGNTITPLLHNTLVKRFAADFNKEFFFNAFVVKYDIADEVWFCIPSFDGSEYASVAYVYNWRDKSWTIIDLPESILRHAAYGTYSQIGFSWDESVDNWSQSSGPWNTSGNSPIESTLVGIQAPGENPNTANGTIVVLDPKSNFTAVPSKVFFERLSIPLEGLNKVTTINRVFPHMAGNGPVWISIGSQDYPGSTIRWKPPVRFDPNLDRKVDIRSTGELHSIRIENAYPQQTEQWWLSGLDIEYVLAGER